MISDGHSISIRVHDSGPGIASGNSGSSFSTIRNADKANGLGLGLALSRQAVLDHGGEMWVEPSLEGACFALRLPLDPKVGTVNLMPTPVHRLFSRAGEGRANLQADFRANPSAWRRPTLNIGRG